MFRQFYFITKLFSLILLFTSFFWVATYFFHFFFVAQFFSFFLVMIFFLHKFIFLLHFYLNQKKNHATFKNKLAALSSSNLSKQSCNLWLFFYHRFLPRQKSMHTLKKHCANRKTLPWENHIGCQMCQIACSKVLKKVFKFFLLNKGCMTFCGEVAWLFLTTVNTVTTVIFLLLS